MLPAGKCWWSTVNTASLSILCWCLWSVIIVITVLLFIDTLTHDGEMHITAPLLCHVWELGRRKSGTSTDSRFSHVCRQTTAHQRRDSPSLDQGLDGLRFYWLFRALGLWSDQTWLYSENTPIHPFSVRPDNFWYGTENILVVLLGLVSCYPILIRSLMVSTIRYIWSG